jgi:tetratricopeptide (TPR) repeat protein
MDDQAIAEQEKPKELVYAEQLISQNEYNEALQVVAKLGKREDVPLYHKVSAFIIQARMLMFLGKHERSIKITEKAYEESLKLGNSLQTIDALNLMALVNNWQGKFDKSYEIIKKSEEIFKNLTKESTVDYIRAEAYLNFIKGYLESLNDANKGLEYLNYSISLWNKIDFPLGKAMTIMCIGLTLYNSKGELDQSIKHLEQALKIVTDINSKYGIAFVQQHLGASYSYKGDINRSIDYFQKSLKLYTEINNKPQIANLHCEIGDIMREKGEFDEALQYVEKALAIYKELGSSFSRGLFSPLGLAIGISIEKDDINLAYDYLKEVKQINEEFKLPLIDQWISFYNSLILKKSSRTRDRANAEELLKKILSNPNIWSFAIKINALIHLCDIYLGEFRNTNNLEVLEDIKPLIENLINIAQKSNSYSILCETFILQARLALITLEVKKARRYLTQAQELAKKYGMDLLAMKISNEHDELLNQLNIWESLKQSNSSIAERIKFTNLGDQIDIMLHRYVDESIKLSEEKPILVLITSKGGTPVFSKSFKEDFSFKDHLWSGFLTAFNSFCDEMLSEGLDRAKFGDYTLIMKSITPFLVFYLFKGQSYLAQHKMKTFIDKVKNDEIIWQTFKNYYQQNQEVQLKDIPILDEVLTQTFLSDYVLESLK